MPSLLPPGVGSVMCVGQALQDFTAYEQNDVQRHFLARGKCEVHQLSQVGSLDILHHQNEFLVLGKEVEDAHHVLVIECCGGLCLVDEVAHEAFVGGQVGQDLLEDDAALEPGGTG